MRTILYERYGSPDVLQLRDVPDPIPGNGQMKIQVLAAAVNPKDVLIRSGKFPRLAGSKFPKFTGFDFAGRVVALGPGVRGVAVGDSVFGMLDGFQGGACADFVVAAARGVAPKPERLTFIEAAAIPLAAQTALQALRDLACVTRGDHVCINGASGGVGTLAVQIAKALGAQVTALCGGASAELVKSLGADRVFDYHRLDPARLGERFDCFFDVFGNESFGTLKHLLTRHGVYVTTVPKMRNLLDHLRTAWWPGRRARLVIVRPRSQDLELLSGWIRDGRLRPVIAQVLPLAEIQRAHELIQTKRTPGKIVVTIQSS